MHWDSSLFLCIVFLGVLCCFLPLRLKFQLTHRQHWQAALTLSIPGFQHKFELGNQPAQSDGPGGAALQYSGKREHEMRDRIQRVDGPARDTAEIHQYKKSNRFNLLQRRKIHIEWKNLGKFCQQVVKIFSHQLHLEQLSCSCRVGWTRPDWTAYGCGLFWSAVSLLPEHWQREGSFIYLPDFEQKRQEVDLQGIIRCTIGQCILILILLLRLLGIALWEQRKKERLANES